MQVPRDPCALAHARLQRHLELMMQLPDAQLVRRPEQRQKEARAESAKPIRLVIRRNDEEIQLGGAFVPDAVAIRCDHAEGILPGRQIRVERLPARASLVPITVIAVEAVAKIYLLRNRKSGRGVINLQVPRIRRNIEVGRCLELFSVSDERFDVCLGRERFWRKPGRIHHLHDHSAGKPHAPIRGASR